MMTEKDLVKVCEEICAGAGYEFTIPVKINKRLTRTLGRVFWVRANNGQIHSTLMEISYQLLSTATEESIMAVVAHECAHYLVNEETHQNHGHDAIFKAMCARIGCSNDGAVYHTLENKAPQEQIYKYFVTCKKCGQIVSRYHRAGKVVQHPELYKCKCCGGPLKVNAQQELELAQIEQKTANVQAQKDKEVALIAAEKDKEVAAIEAEKAKIKAEGAAEAIRIKAEAEAEANKKIAESLTPELIEKQKIDKWNGKVPSFMGGDTVSIISFDNSIK